MVEDDIPLLLEHLVVVGLVQVVECLTHCDPHARSRPLALAPIEDELVGDRAEELLGDRFHFVPLVVVEIGARACQQVEDDELGISHAFGDDALLFFVQVLAQADQATEVLIDVELARVVLSDELLDPTDELDPGGVAARAGLDDLWRRRLASRSAAVCLRSP